MTDKVVILTTCESADQASKLARHLVEQRLAACVNIIPDIASVYRWKDEIEDAREILLIVKSRRELVDRVRAEIEKRHSYEIPEVLAIPVVDGSEAYLAWLDHELAK